MKLPFAITIAITIVICYLLFADDTSLFSVVHDINTSASDLNEELEEIGNWDFK